MLWRAMFDTKAYKELYSPAEEHTFPWDMGMNEDQVVDRVMSKSYMTMLGDKTEEVVKQIRKVVQEGNKDWIDKEVRRLCVARLTSRTVSSSTVTTATSSSCANSSQLCMKYLHYMTKMRSMHNPLLLIILRRITLWSGVPLGRILRRRTSSTARTTAPTTTLRNAANRWV